MLNESTIENWLTLYRDTENRVSTDIEIKGHRYSLLALKKIAEGGWKTVYALNEQDCIFIPKRNPGDAKWENTIKQEKNTLDNMISLGLKAQKFEIVNATIHSAEGEEFTIPVLMTNNLHYVCEQESIVIYDSKNSATFGSSEGFNFARENFENKEFCQQMLRPILKDYAVGYTYSQPISSVIVTLGMSIGLDDSQHIRFERQKNPNEAPKARYMFWDVVGDISKTRAAPYPVLPTLEELKRGARGRKNSSMALETISEEVAIALAKVKTPSFNGEEIAQEIEKNLPSEINETTSFEEIVEKMKKLEALSFLSEEKCAELQNVVLELLAGGIRIQKKNPNTKVFSPQKMVSSLVSKTVEFLSKNWPRTDNSEYSQIKNGLFAASQDEKFLMEILQEVREQFTHSLRENFSQLIDEFSRIQEDSIIAQEEKKAHTMCFILSVLSTGDIDIVKNTFMLFKDKNFLPTLSEDEIKRIEDFCKTYYIPGDNNNISEYVVNMLKSEAKANTPSAKDSFHGTSVLHSELSPQNTSIKTHAPPSLLWPAEKNGQNDHNDANTNEPSGRENVTAPPHNRGSLH